MNGKNNLLITFIGICIVLLWGATSTVVFAEQGEVISSYGPINQTETFDQIKAGRMAVKSERAKQHKELLTSRYDLTEKTSDDVVRSGGKPIPVGAAANLQGVTWKALDKMTPEQIKEKGLFPYKPLSFVKNDMDIYRRVSSI